MRQVREHSDDGPCIEIVTDDAHPAIRVVHQGTGNAIEVVKPDGTVLASIGADGAPAALMNARHDIVMAKSGLISETFYRLLVTSSGTPATQTSYFVAIPLRAGDVITKIAAYLATKGVGAAPTLIKLGLFDKNGVVLGQTANVAADAQWTTTANKGVVFTLDAPVAIETDDLYYAAFLKNGAFATTDIGLSRTAVQSGFVGQGIDGGLDVLKSATGQTDFPADGQTQVFQFSGVVPFWFGVK